MIVRYATTADATMLSELGAKTFFESFAKDNTPENMAAYIKSSFSPEVQHKELSMPDTVFLIAEIEGRAIGYAQLVINSKDEAIQRNTPLEIRRIYALQEWIGKGIGKELMKTTIQEAKLRGCDSIWLSVWEKNPRAIGFYKKWGFREVGTHIFKVGDDPQQDFIMELKLTSHHLSEK